MKRLLIAVALLCALPAAAQVSVGSRAGMWYSRSTAYTIGQGVYSCSGGEVCLGVLPLTGGGTGASSWAGAASRIVRVNSGGTALQATGLSEASGVLTFPSSLGGLYVTLAAANNAIGALTLPTTSSNAFCVAPGSAFACCTGAGTGTCGSRLVAGPNANVTDDGIPRWDGISGIVQDSTLRLLDSGALKFSTAVDTKISLWGNVYQFGIEPQTMTIVTDDRFRFRLANAACDLADTCRTAGDEKASLTAAGFHFGAAGDPTATLHATQSILGFDVLRLESAATNDDPTLTMSQARAATTTATTATMANVSIASATVVMVEAHVIAHCTGGGSCSGEAGAGYVLRGTYRNNGGTVSLIGSLVAEANETVGFTGWDATLTIAGTLVNLDVTGAGSTNITWHADVQVRRVGT